MFAILTVNELMGAGVEAPVVVDGMVATRQMVRWMTISMPADSAAVDCLATSDAADKDRTGPADIADGSGVEVAAGRVESIAAASDTAAATATGAGRRAA